MSTAPALLPDGQVVLAGKSRIVYLLNGAHLGGIGGQQATLGDGSHAIVGSACSNDIDGGIAVLGMTVYLPCTSGIIAVRVTQSPPALHLLWSSGTGGGPPIVAAGLVWTIGQNGVLYGLDPATGQVRQQVIDRHAGRTISRRRAWVMVSCWPPARKTSSPLPRLRPAPRRPRPQAQARPTGCQAYSAPAAPATSPAA